MKYEPGDEVYCVGYTGRWRVDTVSPYGHPVACTRLDRNMNPITVMRHMPGASFDDDHAIVMVEDQQNMSLNKIEDFELCVVRDMREAQRLARMEAEAIARGSA